MFLFKKYSENRREEKGLGVVVLSFIWQMVFIVQFTIKVSNLKIETGIDS